VSAVVCKCGHKDLRGPIGDTRNAVKIRRARDVCL